MPSNPASPTSRFEPRPITSTSTAGAAASAPASGPKSDSPSTRTRSPIGPPHRYVVSGAEGALRQLERSLVRSVLLKLEPEHGGYVRVSDARLEPPNKKRGQSKVIKRLIWAALLSSFMALASVLARRVADTVWRATVHEEPPTEKSKVAS